MEKKRRENNIEKKIINSKNIISDFQSISNSISIVEKCGIYAEKQELKPDFGIGSIQFFKFKGISFRLIDAVLYNDILLKGSVDSNFLELSYLIEGEQIIKINGCDEDFVVENQECYLVYLSQPKGTINFPKNKKIKELKIRMNSDFINKHQLNSEENIFKNYDLKNFQKINLIAPLSAQNQRILFEIFSNKQDGLLKRLFLEAKALELIGIQLSSKQHLTRQISAKSDNIVKKIYEVQHFISSNLSNQLSIKELSKKIGVNDFVLKKEFKRVFDKTIFEYATEIRMNKAKELLTQSKKPIYEISEIIGYKNPTHFTAAFKKIEGTTPKKYRVSKIIET